MSCTVNQILNEAKKHLGVKEGSSGHHNIINTYNSHRPLARGYKVKYSDNWCATFISFLAIKCGATDIIPTECSCGQMIELMKKKGIWNENDDITPKAGDIIMYDWDKKDGWPEHVGIVEKVSGNTITVIEGNKSDAVSRRNIKVGDPNVRGYGQPNYKKEPEPSKPKPTPTNKIAEDGLWGIDTTKRAQQVFGTPVDGKISGQSSKYKKDNPGLLSSTFEWKLIPIKRSDLIKAIQKKVGVKQDGRIGPDTIRAMQRWLGTPVDGKVSNPSQMIKAFQKWLNKQ